MSYKAMYKGQRIGGASGGGGSSAPAGSNIPSGGIIAWMGPTAPDGWILCDGAEYPITDYPALASAIEAQHGAKNFFGGDGEDTFAVPDLRGRFPLGANTEVDEEGNQKHPIGETGGEEEVTLTIKQLAAHTHGFPVISSNGVYGGNGYRLEGNSDSSNKYVSAKNTVVGETGNGAPHPNMPPFLVLTFIIKI